MFTTTMYIYSLVLKISFGVCIFLLLCIYSFNTHRLLSRH